MIVKIFVFSLLQALIQDPSKVSYEMKDIDVPSFSGRLFSFLTWLAFTRFGQLVMVPVLMKGAGVFKISGEYIPEHPTMNFRMLIPPPPEEDNTQENREVIQRLLDKENGEQDSEFRFPSVRDYYTAYKDERCTPLDVANVILEAIKETNSMVPPLRAIVDHSKDEVLKMAQASTDRWKDGKPLSVLDGVPVSIKGEFCTKPYTFRCGSMFKPIFFSDANDDAHLVQNLKEAGAVIIGITNMQEFGTGTLGSNPNRYNGIPRNPYNTGCYAGGSSSGSAVSVAAGLCPISLGADGGGSVRIPASICGLVGFKPTHGLLKGDGTMPIADTLACAGPLCGSALDAIVAMNVLSRNLEGETILSLRGVGEKSLDGLRVGIYRECFDHCEESVHKVCQPSLKVLEDLGAKIVDIKIPEMEDSRIAHLITIVCEMANGLSCDVDNHFSLFNAETLLLICSGFNLRAVDYVNAQKQRTRAITFFQNIFKEVDVIVTPTTACVAPTIDPDAISHGKVMAVASGKLVRFLGLGNLTGNPGITFPLGLSREGLPVGLQLMGKWYDDSTLLNIAWALERSNRFPTAKPKVFHDILNTATDGQ